MAKNAFALTVSIYAVAVLSVPAAASGKAAPLRSDLFSWPVAPPELVLNLGTEQKPLRFTVARLEHMTRSVVCVASHNGQKIRTLEGVDISWLTFPGYQPKGGETRVTVQRLRLEGEFLRKDKGERRLEISYGLFRKKRIPFSEMDAESKVIIIDKVDRINVPGCSPFRLVIVTGQGRTLLYNLVTQISVKPSR